MTFGVSHNNSLEPTPVTKARFFGVGSGAAQLSRYVPASIEIKYEI
jgi:hypothetical protein